MISEKKRFEEESERARIQVESDKHQHINSPFTFACIFVLAERFVASQEDRTYQESKC